MARRNLYKDPDSVLARKEGVWVPDLNDSGTFNMDELVSITALILRDAHRGWAYDEYGDRIPFDLKRAGDRVRYLHALCYPNVYDRSICREFWKEVAKPAMETGRIPRGPWRVVLAGPNAEKVAKELIDYGIVDADMVYVLKEKEGEKRLVPA